MANKYETGTYYILVSDSYGTKTHSEHNIESLVEAVEIADALVEHSTESYVISRVLRNSLDKKRA